MNLSQRRNANQFIWRSKQTARFASSGRRNMNFRFRPWQQPASGKRISGQKRCRIAVSGSQRVCASLVFCFVLFHFFVWNEILGELALQIALLPFPARICWVIAPSCWFWTAGQKSVDLGEIGHAGGHSGEDAGFVQSDSCVNQKLFCRWIQILQTGWVRLLTEISGRPVARCCASIFSLFWNEKENKNDWELIITNQPSCNWKSTDN